MDDWEDEAQYTREGVCPLLLRSSTYKQHQLQWSVFSLSFFLYIYHVKYTFLLKKKNSWRVCDLLWKKIVGGGFVVGFETVIYHIPDPGCFSRNVFMTA